MSDADGPDPAVAAAELEVHDPEDVEGTHFELYRDSADQWRWRLVHQNGNIIADGGEGYARKAGAKNGIESVKRNADDAPVVRTPDEEA